MCGCHPFPLLVISKAATPPRTREDMIFLRRNFDQALFKSRRLEGSSLLGMVRVRKRGHCSLEIAWFHLLKRRAERTGAQEGHQRLRHEVTVSLCSPQQVQVSMNGDPQASRGSARSSAPSSRRRETSSSLCPLFEARCLFRFSDSGTLLAAAVAACFSYWTPPRGLNSLHADRA